MQQWLVIKSGVIVNAQSFKALQVHHGDTKVHFPHKVLWEWWEFRNLIFSSGYTQYIYSYLCYKQLQLFKETL